MSGCTAFFCLMKTIHHNDDFQLYLKVLVGILIFLILIFYLFPDMPPVSRNRKSKIEVPIQVSEIPRTQQSRLQRTSKNRLRIPLPGSQIPVEMAEADLPEDLELNSASGLLADVEPSIMGQTQEPRPVVDVYPDISRITCDGQIKLLLEINRKGQVVRVNVLEYSIDNEKCLQAAIRAAYQSRWEPGMEQTYVVKIYRFKRK